MVDFSSLRDNHFDLAQSTEIFERILCGDDEVCTFSRLDRSGFGSDSCHLGGAGVDAFDSEPCMDSPLIFCENAVLTPHTAPFTSENFCEMNRRAAQNVLDFLNGTLDPKYRLI